ncbi:MAG TPA: NUDIX domain-containing protein [Candidatus Saccharimonadales bacterium]|nr:NUDIX domain-containing protein [Candidatus Saccharimonadales bacterium]
MAEDSFHLGVKALIRNKAGKVLLLKVNPAMLTGNKHGIYWDLPGGRVQKGQTVQDTLKREVAEETGITDLQSVKPVSMVLSNIRIPFDNGDSVGLILSVYECAVPDDVPITISEENLAAEWFAPAKAAELLAVKYPAEFCAGIAAL